MFIQNYDILRYMKNKKIVFLVIVVLLLFARIGYYIYTFNFKYSEDEVVREVMVVELKKVAEERITYLVRYDKNNFLLNIYGSVGKEFKTNDYANFKYADKLKINGKITIPELLHNPNEFNYKRYLNSNKIVGVINTYRAEKVGEKYGNIFLKLIYNYKNLVNEKIVTSLPKERAGLLTSMIYGDTTLLEEDIKNDLNINGMSHITAVSGANISYILLVVSSLFNEENKKEKKLKLMFSIVIITIFCAIASFSASVLRAGIMNIVILVFKYYNVRINKYFALIFSALLLVTYNPYIIFNISFILSYLAVLSIITFFSEINSFFDVKLKNFLKYDYIETNKLKVILYNFFKCINKILSMYISVQILVLPVQIYYFNEISVTSFLANIVIYPLASIVFFLGFLVLFLMFIPFVSTILFSALNLMIFLLIKLSTFCTKFACIVNIPKPAFYIVILYYIFFIAYRYRKKAILYFKRENVKKAKLLLSIFLSLYIFFVALYYINILYLENYVYYFNVGQGNMAFIRYQRKNILIDCGSTTKNLARNVLEAFLKQKGISKIDVCFLTHFHNDHINLLLSNGFDIPIEKIVYEEPKVANENYEKIKNFAKEKNIAFVNSNIGDSFKYKDITLEILAPDINEVIVDKDIENANSQVILVKVNGIYLLFMGDATCKTEEYLLKRNIKLENIKIMQVGHHGSITSTSQEFIDSLKVENAIISSKKKVYGHPSKEIVDRLKSKGIKIYITENDGAIKFDI